jgi:hypothetical protein
MRNLKWMMLLGIAARFVCVHSTALAAPQARNNQTHLEREVAALTMISELELTELQLKAIEPICKEATVRAPATTAPAGTDRYRASLRALREALVQADEEKIAEQQQKVDALREAEKIEPDTDIPASDVARARASGVLAMLATSQVANYISSHAEDVPGALETITDAIDQCRQQNDADFAALRTEAAEQTGLLLAGVDKSAAKPIEQKVTDLLDKAKKLSDAEFKSQHEALVNQAKQIAAGADPIEGLRHWMQQEIASLLSNPATADAITARLQAMPRRR